MYRQDIILFETYCHYRQKNQSSRTPLISNSKQQKSTTSYNKNLHLQNVHASHPYIRSPCVVFEQSSTLKRITDLARFVLNHAIENSSKIQTVQEFISSTIEKLKTNITAANHPHINKLKTTLQNIRKQTNTFLNPAT